MQEYNYKWTLKEKLIFILQQLGRAHTPYEVLEAIRIYESSTNITTSAILLCSRSHPDYLGRYHDIENDCIIVGLAEWFSELETIKPEFTYIHTPLKVRSRVKYGSNKIIRKELFLPISFKEEDLGPVTFTKKTFDTNLEYSCEWITSNKILYLLSKSPSLSIDQIVETIVEFEPSQKRRVKRVRENVEICIKRLLRDQKIAQLTTNTYYLTIY